MELNTSQSQGSQINSKPHRNPILLIGIGVVVILLVGMGLLLWQKNQEIGQALSQLSDTEKRLTDSLNSNKDKSANVGVEQKAMETLSESEQKQQATLGASAYYCAISNFGCDKVTTIVTKFQKATDTTSGYAKVVATNGSDKKLTLWLKYRVGGSDWIVFYEGEALPPAVVVERFAVPADFLAVN